MKITLQTTLFTRVSRVRSHLESKNQTVSHGCVRGKAGVGRCCCPDGWERSGEHAGGELRGSRAQLFGHLPRLPSKLSQQGAQTSAVPAQLLQKMFAFTFEEFGRVRLQGRQRDQTTWVAVYKHWSWLDYREATFCSLCWCLTTARILAISTCQHIMAKCKSMLNNTRTIQFSWFITTSLFDSSKCDPLSGVQAGVHGGRCGGQYVCEGRIWGPQQHRGESGPGR